MVFEMRHYEGMRLKAIGDALGTSEEAAKNCLFRATQKMRMALEIWYDLNSASRYFSSLLYGELTFEEEDKLRQHLETCGRCLDDFEREQRLHQALDRYQAEIPGTLLAECRRSLREEIGELRNHKRSLFSRLGEFASMGPWTRPLGALALIAIGFFAARLTEPGTGPDPAPVPVEAAAYRVRNIEPKPSGRVELVVDETTPAGFIRGFGRPQDTGVSFSWRPAIPPTPEYVWNRLRF